MATYTAIADGDWDNYLTWGSTPGSYPQANGDIVNISVSGSGYKVKYNIGESTVTWGSITVGNGGMLYFPTDASSKMIFAAESVLTINSGGEVRTGTSSAAGAVGSAYTCKIHFNQPSAAKNVIDHKNGGIINIWGDTAYYGSTAYAYLSANWTSGQSFYVTGDFSAKWIAGQKFWIYKNPDTVESYTTSSKIYTIATVGSYDSGNNRTQITISESAPGVTFQATSASGYTSPIIMLSRNVEIADPGTTLSIGVTYTERCRLTSAQTGSNFLVDLRACMLYGFDYWGGCTNFKFANFLVTCCSNFVYTGSNIDFTGDVVGLLSSIGYTSSASKFVGHIVGTQNGGMSMPYSYWQGDGIANKVTWTNANVALRDCTWVGNCVGCDTGVSFSNSLWIGHAYANNMTIASSYGITWIGNSNRNTTETYTIGFRNRWIGDVDASPVFSTTGSLVREDSTVAGTARFPERHYQVGGTMSPLVSGDSGWVAPDSGNTWILQVTPNSTCDDFPTHLNQIVRSPIAPIAAYCTSGSKTLTYKIYPSSGWTLRGTNPNYYLNQDDVVLEVSYLDSASGITRTTVYNTSQTYAVSGWRSCSVTFNPSQNGIIYINMYIRCYESGDYILIDPVFTVA